MKEIQADRMWADGQSRGLAHVPAAEKNVWAALLRGSSCLGPGGDLLGVEVARPKVETWLEQRAILKALRSPNIETRRGVVRDLEHKSPAIARDYLVEALGDPSIDVRLAACRRLAIDRWH